MAFTVPRLQVLTALGRRSFALLAWAMVLTRGMCHFS
jgi:hypothetical protein